MIVGKGAYRINLEKNVTPRFCFLRVLRLPRRALLLTVKQAIDIIRGTEGVFVTNVKAITKEGNRAHYSCGKHIPISTRTVTAMRGRHDFIERLLFIH